MARKVNVTEHSAEYKSAISSSHWKRLRAVKIRHVGKKCERCGLAGPDSEVELSLHHKHYRSLGHEYEDDVELLCNLCHEIADDERASETESRRDQNRFDAGLNTFATKKYGDSPEYWPDDVEEQFDNWLESKNW